MQVVVYSFKLTSAKIYIANLIMIQNIYASNMKI